MRVSEKGLAMAVVMGTLPVQVQAERGLCSDGHTARARVTGEVDTCLMVGAGITGGESEYPLEDDSTAFPVISLNYGSFYWEIDEIGFYLLGEETDSLYWGIAPLLEFSNGGFDTDGEYHLVGLDDRDPTLEGGIKLVAGGMLGDVELGINNDLEDEHEGYNVYASYELPLHFGSLTVSPGVSWRYRDEKNGDYYYGVDADEASPDGRVAYAVDEPTNSLGTGYSIVYSPDSAWSIFHFLEVRLLDDVIKDSPLTVNDKAVEVSFGALYRYF